MVVVGIGAVWGRPGWAWVVVTSWMQLAQWEGFRKGDLKAVFGSSGRQIEGRV